MSRRTLAEATAVNHLGDGRFAADAGEEARIPGGLVNGGVLLVVAARALAEATGRPHPVTITGHYLAAVRPGPLTIDTEVLRSGRHAFARALVRNGDGAPVLATTGTFGDLATANGLNLAVADLPPMPDRDRAIPWPPEDGGDTHAPSVFSLFRHQVVPDGVGWALGRDPGEALLEAWATPASGAWDPVDLLALADVYPPPIFNAGVPFAWVPTLELTVQLRGLPRGDEEVACRFWTSSVTDGYLEEDGLIRGTDGRLLAVSRQLALAPRPPDR